MTTIIFHGPVINPLSLTAYNALPRCLIAVAHDGNILWIVDDVDPATLRDTIAHRGLQSYTLVDLKPGEFIMPGLVDTHTVRSPLPPLPLLIRLPACLPVSKPRRVRIPPRLRSEMTHLCLSAEVTWSSSIGSLHIPFPRNPNSKTWTMPSAYIPTSSTASSRPA